MAISKITDQLYLCGIGAITRERLIKNSIAHVINCTNKAPIFNVPGIKTTRICVKDDTTERLDEHFDMAADKIHETCVAGGKVLVHCALGVSRSATVCIAYLMKHHNLTLIKAHEFVQKHRSIIHPNPGFWKQLVEYEKAIYGENTVQMIKSSKGLIPDIYKEGAK